MKWRIEESSYIGRTLFQVQFYSKNEEWLDVPFCTYDTLEEAKEYIKLVESTRIVNYHEYP